MKNPIISIIIPIHNAGIYLEEALKTIFSQTFQQFELICIDDASDDKVTNRILGVVQNAHENVQIVKLKNRVGAAEARNIGFSKAKGEYVIFLDADDIFMKDLLEEMYSCITENQADVCICGYDEFYIKDGEKKFVGRYIPDDYIVFCQDREDWLLRLSTVPWNKLCRTQFLKENHIYFQSLSSSNDVFFSCMVMINAVNTCFVKEKSLIYYRTKTDTQISANRNPNNLYEAVMLINKTEQKRVNKDLVFQWGNVMLLWNGIHELKRSKNEVYNQKFYNLLKDYFRNFSVNFQNKLLNKCLENMKMLPYESKWFNALDDLLGQLKLMETNIKKELNKSEELYLWGTGNRGKIFEHFCLEAHIDLQGVADIKNCNIGGITDYGNKIVSTEYVLKSKGLIIASNTIIYEYLAKRNVKLLNLDQFSF